MSPFGGFLQRSVLGPAGSVKYSIHSGRENVEGRFNAVKDDRSGGMLNADPFCVLGNLVLDMLTIRLAAMHEGYDGRLASSREPTRLRH